MELKFRAKNPETNKWSYFGIYNVPSWVDEDNVQPFMGLEDRNVTPIFEGDVIVNHWNGHKQKLLVCNSSPVIDQTGWLKTRGGISFEILSGEKMLYQLHPEHFEVIGNITDNPELLEHAQ